MATVTGLTAERMLEIEGASIVDGRVVDGELILTKHDGTEINAGPVDGPPGPPGPTGAAGLGAIPGEVKLWSGDTLPDLATYGKWVWADGAYYLIEDYPLAAAHISDEWRTFDAHSDPGPLNFRVPDLRGLVAAGMDAMPGGTRANRMTRSVAIILAEKSGKETHSISVPEMPSHAHGGVVAVGGGGYHDRAAPYPWVSGPTVPGWSGTYIGTLNAGPQGTNPYDAYNLFRDQNDPAHQHAIPSEGGNNGHENVQPTVFVPYIVCLDV